MRLIVEILRYSNINTACICSFQRDQSFPVNLSGRRLTLEDSIPGNKHADTHNQTTLQQSHCGQTAISHKEELSHNLPAKQQSQHHWAHNLCYTIRFRKPIIMLATSCFSTHNIEYISVQNTNLIKTVNLSLDKTRLNQLPTDD